MPFACYDAWPKLADAMRTHHNHAIVKGGKIVREGMKKIKKRLKNDARIKTSSQLNIGSRFLRTLMIASRLKNSDKICFAAGFIKGPVSSFHPQDGVWSA